MINQSIRGIFKPKKIKHLLYRVMEEKDYDKVAEITTSAFIANEPITRGGMLQESDFVEFFNILKPHFINSKASIVAVDTTKNVIAGSRCDHLNKIPFKMKIIAKWLEDIKHQLIFNKLIPEGKGKIYQLGFGAIQQEYSNQGIIKQISLFNQELAWKLGFNYILSEAASPITQHIYSQLGFSTIYFYSYDHFQKVMGDELINQTALNENFRGQPPGLKIMFKKLNEDDFKQE